MPLWTPTRLLTLLLALALIGCGSPKANKLEAPITQQLEQGIRSGSERFDHAAWNTTLTTWVDAKTGRVDYAGLKKDRAGLDGYVASLSTVDLRKLPRDEQLALLINAYNAFTLTLIIDHLDGLKSIRDLPSPWDTPAYTLGGHKVSLNDIEHGLIRPIFKDPRIHFAVNCASIGCPPLANRAYTGPELDAQLTEAARRFATDPAYVEVKDDALHVSKILDWYGADFTDPAFKGRASSVPTWLMPVTSEEVRAFIDSKGDAPTVTFKDYNWNLNAKQ